MRLRALSKKMAAPARKGQKCTFRLYRVVLRAKRRDIILLMPKQHAKNQQHIPESIDKSVAIADVPVKITFLHGDEKLQEYEDIIDLTFDTKTAAGKELGKRMAILTMREGLATEEALFKIASDEIHTHAAAMLQTMTHTDILKRAAGHEVHLRVLRNGDITYRMPMKE